MTAPSEALLCGRSFAEIAGSNPAGEHIYLSVVSVLCRQVEVCVAGRSLVQRSLTKCGVDRRGQTK